MNSNNQRTYFFDNYKALLIILVIIGHFIEPCYENNQLLTGLKWIIFSFHMPAFIFISGYFSKKKSSFEKLVQKLVIPYFVYELLYYFLYVCVIHKDTGLYLTRPKFSLWYIMALFFWRLATPYFQKIPGHFFVAVTAGLMIGLTNMDNFLSIPRTLFFYPFFLAGYHFKLEWFARIRQNALKWFNILAASLTVFLSITAVYNIRLTPKIFYGRYSYADMGTANETGVMVRLACYLLSFLIIFALCCVIPKNRQNGPSSVSVPCRFTFSTV